MKEDIDVRKDKSVDYPEFFQELQKLIDKYKVTFDKDDSVFIYSNIGSIAACLSAGRALSQVIGLGQIMGMREDILNMLTNAIIEHLKNKGDIAYTCALLSQIMDYACPNKDMSKLYEKMTIAFLETYQGVISDRKKIN